MCSFSWCQWSWTKLDVMILWDSRIGWGYQELSVRKTEPKVNDPSSKLIHHWGMQKSKLIHHWGMQKSQLILWSHPWGKDQSSRVSSANQWLDGVVPEPFPCVCCVACVLCCVVLRVCCCCVACVLLCCVVVCVMLPGVHSALCLDLALPGFRDEWLSPSLVLPPAHLLPRQPQYLNPVRTDYLTMNITVKSPFSPLCGSALILDSACFPSGVLGMY